MVGSFILGLRPGVGRLIAKADENGREVERRRRVGARVAFRETQRLRQHVSHRVDVGEHAIAQLMVRDVLRLKPKPRERRAKIVRN